MKKKILLNLLNNDKNIVKHLETENHYNQKNFLEYCKKNL